MAAGDYHSLVLTAEGTLLSFGKGDGGQLGHGDEADQPRPKSTQRACQKTQLYAHHHDPNGEPFVPLQVLASSRENASQSSRACEFAKLTRG